MEILPNGVAVIKNDTHHRVWVAQEGLVHDKFMSRIIRDAIRRHHVTVCVDAGANIGTLTKAMLDENCAVVAFEPNPDAADCLAHNCPQAILVRQGLSDRAGLERLTKEQNAGASYLSKTPERTIKVDPAEALVPVTSLDEFYFSEFTTAPMPELIKLDIEGSEFAALLGAKRVIEKSRPVIISEINHGALARNGHTALDVVSLLSRYGYRFDIIQPECDFQSPQYDIIATPV